MVEKTEGTQSDKDNTDSNDDVSRRNTDPHWLLNELNEILEKGMFKHD